VAISNRFTALEILGNEVAIRRVRETTGENFRILTKESMILEK
jgi:hypothetical protein